MSRLRRVMLSAFGVLALAVGLAACGSSSNSGSTAAEGSSGSSSSGAAASGGDEQTWVHGILKPKGDSGYFLMAKERNLFAKMGVKVQIKEFVGNVQLVQALVSGAIDSGGTSVEPIYDGFQRGAPVKIIGSSLPGPTYAVVASSKIKTWKDLEGKTIGASAPGAFPDVLTRAMLAAKGLDPKGVNVVAAGSDAQRYQALLAGRIDAAAMSVEFIPKTTGNPKVHLLGQAQDIVPQYMRFAFIGNTNSLQKKPDAAVKFMAAQMQGLCYAVQNPKAEIALAAKNLGVPATDPSLVYDQKVISKAHAASPTMAIPMKRLEFVQKFRMEQGFQKQAIDLSKLVDPSYREKALELAKLPADCLNDPNIKQ